MPVGSPSAPPRQIVMLLVATVVGIVAMVFLFTRTTDLAQSGDVQLNIGDRVFAPGNVDRLAEDIEEKGPLLLSDPAGGDRDIILQHRGDDALVGWSAFAARPAEAVRDCVVVWNADAERFDYPCDDRIFPADGEGLFQYPVTIDADGNLTVDLNAVERTTTTESN